MALLFSSITLDLLFILSSLLAYLYFKLKEKQKYFERHGMQYLKSTLLIGRIDGLLFRESPSETFVVLYKQMKHMKVGGFFSLFAPNVLVTDPDVAWKVLVKDFHHFRDHANMHIDTEVNPLEGHLFNLTGNKWKAVRNKLTPAFSSGKLKEMYPLMVNCADVMVRNMTNIKPEDDILIKDFMSKYTCHIIGTCGFGLDLGDIESDDNVFVHKIKQMMSPNPVMVYKFIFRMLFPKVFSLLKLRTIDKDLNDFFISIVKQAFEHRKKTGYYRKDFVQLLLEIKEKGSVNINPEDYDANDIKEVDTSSPTDKVEITDEVLAAQAFIFFVGGFETTGSSMAFVIYLLSKNLEAQNKLRKEIREVKAMYNGQITYEGLKKMTYLEHCISETLRLYPPLSTTFRSCTKDYTFEDGSRINKGTSLFIPTQAIQMDPEYFKDPEEFRPERFEEDIVPGTYTAFGEGPRTCIAKRFALLGAKLGIAAAIDNFTFEWSAKNVEPFRMNPAAFTLTPIEGVWVKVKKIQETSL